MRSGFLMPMTLSLLCMATPLHAQTALESDSDYLQKRASALDSRIDSAVRQHRLTRKKAASLHLAIGRVQTEAGHLQTVNGTISRPDADRMNQALTNVERALPVAADTGRAEPSHGGETAAKAAAFRYLFANNASALKTRAATYCIGTGPAGTPTNPNPELLAALSNVRPKVRPVSACQAGTRVVDRAGRPALIFNLETIECDGVTNCLFRGGYYEANVSGSGATYRARFVNGRWQITQEGPIAIS